MSHLGAITLVVRDDDDAIDFYTKSLGFDLIEDTEFEAGKRWVLIASPQSGSAATHLHTRRNQERRRTRNRWPTDRRSGIIFSPYR